MVLWPLKFDEIFKISTMTMRLNGSFPNVAARNKLWLFKILTFRIIGTLSFFLLVNSIVYHDVRDGKYTEAVKNGIMAIVAVTVIFKHSILVHRPASIKELIKFIDNDYQDAEDFSNEEKEIVLKYARKGKQICLFWLIAGGLSGLIFPIKAFVLMVYHCLKKECHLVQMFELTYPDSVEVHKDVFLVYCGMFLIYLIFDVFAMSVYIAFDPFVPIFMLHTCGQLDLISSHLSKALTDASNVQEMNENLKRINIRLAEIYRFVKKVQNIFVILYEFNMKTTTFLIPFSGFQLVEAMRHKEIPVEFTFFFISALLHFYLPCYYSDLLMEKSESLRQAIYNCGWEVQPHVKVRKTILLMLTRTSTPLVIRTVFYPICLNTFAEMGRQAYAIYNIMTAAWG